MGGLLGYGMIGIGRFISRDADSLTVESWCIAIVSALFAVLWGPVIKSLTDGVRYDDSVSTFLLTGILLGGLLYIVRMLIDKARDILDNLPDDSTAPVGKPGNQ